MKNNYFPKSRNINHTTQITAQISQGSVITYKCEIDVWVDGLTLPFILINNNNNNNTITFTSAPLVSLLKPDGRVGV